VDVILSEAKDLLLSWVSCPAWKKRILRTDQKGRRDNCGMHSWRKRATYAGIFAELKISEKLQPAKIVQFYSRAVF